MKTTPSFVIELPLRTKSANVEKINKRFDAGRQLYNACLGEADRRYYLMKQSKEYQAACKMPKGKPRSHIAAERTASFNECNNRFKFTAYDISEYATGIRNSWISDNLESSVAQKLSLRAFKAVQKKSFKIARRIRFKSKSNFNSMEGKSNTQGLIYKNNTLRWSGLKLPAIIDPKDPYQEYGLKQKVKYCRILRRTIKNKLRFSVQLVLEGMPYQNPDNLIGKEEVGLDIGVNTIAYVGDTKAELKQFCGEIKPTYKEITRIQRKMDRSRRAMNPQNYNANGVPKKKTKGVRLVWRKSAQYKKLQSVYAEKNRVLAAYRKSLHGNMANEIISIGTTIKTEKISYQAWQKQYGKSINRSAPSMIVSLLQRKAANAHGHLHEIPTQTTKLSQTCHVCGEQVKKQLSKRWHNCCNVEMQRDLYSAFLAKCVNSDTDILDLTKAKHLWCSLEPVLQSALSRIPQEQNRLTAIDGNHVPSSFGLGQSQSSSHYESEKAYAEVAEVVVQTDESCEKVCATAETLLI